MLLASASGVSCSCGGERLHPVPSSLRVEPTQVDFGSVVLGEASVRVVSVINSGKVSLEGSWALRGEGFRTDDGVPSRAIVGTTPLTITCAPDHVGVFDGVLTITFSGFDPIQVPLSCEAVPVPECRALAPCRESSWDVALGRCVERNLVDGTTCSVADVCLLNPTCHAGRCEGTLIGCDDGDPCTADSCDPSGGCQHQGPIACPGLTPCRVGHCEPGIGCGLEDAPDGTPCGPRRSCSLADVCIAGACVGRDPPDGFQCQGEGPCGGAGKCINDACAVEPSSAIAPAWSQGQAQPDGGPPESWSDLFVARNGSLVLSSYFMSPPRFDARAPAPINLQSLARRCISWLGWIVCGDLPGLATSPVSALNPSTGAIVWTFTDVASMVAEFNGPGVQFFTARLAVLNEDELLVLYETRTLTAEGADPRCRAFAMVVLDRAGQGLRSRFIADPIFATCDHPHSYGVAVDAQSNIYLAFTPSGADNPATSQIGTTIFSFSPALQLRWRVNEPTLEGGELMVANGALFHEKSTTVYSSATGASLASLSAPMGRGAIAAPIAIPGREGATELEAWNLNTHLPEWTFQLSGATGLAPMTLATWDSPWGPREVALAITSTSGSPVVTRLEAIEVATGASAFNCPLTIPPGPIGLSMTPGGLAITHAQAVRADLCDTCDPRFARTKNEFVWVPLPGLTPSAAQWSGAWANEGHTHHEGR